MGGDVLAGNDGDNDKFWKILDLDMWGTVFDDDDNAGRHSRVVIEEAEVLTYAMIRGMLQHMLHEGLADDHGLGVMFGKCLLEILYASSSLSSSSLEGIMCKLYDGCLQDHMAWLSAEMGYSLLFDNM